MDNSYFHGSDSYLGHCPKCGRESETNYNELCEKCESVEPIKCPECKSMVSPDFFNHDHGCCNECLEFKAEDFTERIQSKISSILLAGALGYSKTI